MLHYEKQPNCPAGAAKRRAATRAKPAGRARFARYHNVTDLAHWATHWHACDNARMRPPVDAHDDMYDD